MLSLSFLQAFALGMVSSNLLGKTAQAVAMASEGTPPRQFGIRLLFGVIPHFFISNAQIQALPLPGQRRCYATPMIARLLIFTVGTLIWIFLRPSGNRLAEIALAFAVIGLGAFVFTANPVWRADGYHWTAAALRIRNLREQSYTLLRLYLTGRRRPAAMPPHRGRLLIGYALASIIYTALLIGWTVSSVAVSLEARYSGAGVAMFALLMAASLMFFLAVAHRKRRREAARRKHKFQLAAGSSSPHDGRCEAFDSAEESRRYPPVMETSRLTRSERSTRNAPARAAPASPFDPDLEAILSPEPTATAQDDKDLVDILYGDLASKTPATGNRLAAGPELSALVPVPSDAHGSGVEAARAAPAIPARMPELDSILKTGPMQSKPTSLRTKLILWALALTLGVFLGQLPYAFSVGGEFIVQPAERTQVTARTDGEIVQINVQEGDWVEAGQSLAIQSTWEEERDVAILEADLQKLKAEFLTLTAGPKAAEIALSEQVRAAAAAQMTAAKGGLTRAEQLFQSGANSQAALDQARTDLSVATAGLKQAEAALALLKTPILESEIAAAQAAIRRTEQELSFRNLQLEHTNIRAVSDGQIIGDFSALSVGVFLEEGDLFAEVADTRTILAAIEVPETDIDEVTPGARVVLKTWSAPDQDLIGKVKRVAPAAEEREFGRIIRVIVEVQNDAGRLAENMTGFGKILVDERPAWRVFSRVLVRFFEVEIWSWLP